MNNFIVALTWALIFCIGVAVGIGYNLHQLKNAEIEIMDSERNCIMMDGKYNYRDDVCVLPW